MAVENKNSSDGVDQDRSQQRDLEDVTIKTSEQENEVETEDISKAEISAQESLCKLTMFC